MGSETGQGEIWIKHYSSKHQILLVGEGDFSFSASLARAFVHAPNLIATSLDSEGTLRAKYPLIEWNLKALKDRGSTIMHEVDVRNMWQHSSLMFMSFDRIVFNFPHSGFHSKENDAYQIHFFVSARKMLKADGQVHVTHKTNYPFNLWQIQELGVAAGLRLIEKAPFYLSEYPNYINRKGADNHRDKRRGSSSDTFPVGECRTFKFVK